MIKLINLRKYVLGISAILLLSMGCSTAEFKKTLAKMDKMYETSEGNGSNESSSNKGDDTIYIPFEPKANATNLAKINTNKSFELKKASELNDPNYKAQAFKFSKAKLNKAVLQRGSQKKTTPTFDVLYFTYGGEKYMVYELAKPNKEKTKDGKVKTWDLLAINQKYKNFKNPNNFDPFLILSSDSIVKNTPFNLVPLMGKKNGKPGIVDTYIIREYK